MKKNRMNMIVKMMMGTMVMLSLSAIPIYAQEPSVGEMTTVNSERKSTLLPPGVGTSRDVKHSTTRGSVISTGILEISNEGNGDIGILIETLTHVPCDRIRNKIYLDRWNESTKDWDFIDSYEYNALKADQPNQDLSGLMNSITVKGQPTGYYYRARGAHLAKGNGKIESLSSQTDGVLITKK